MDPIPVASELVAVCSVMAAHLVIVYKMFAWGNYSSSLLYFLEGEGTPTWGPRGAFGALNHTDPFLGLKVIFLTSELSLH